jgi:hypothetical protein
MHTARPVTESAGAVHNAPTITPSEVTTASDDLPF